MALIVEGGSWFIFVRVLWCSSTYKSSGSSSRPPLDGAESASCRVMLHFSRICWCRYYGSGLAWFSAGLGRSFTCGAFGLLSIRQFSSSTSRIIRYQAPEKPDQPPSPLFLNGVMREPANDVPECL